MKERPVRLAPLQPDEWSDEQAEILAPISAGRGLGRGVINVFATLVRHPKLCKRWFVFATHVMFKSSLNARDREVLILRTAFLCQSPYEWAQHVSLGRDAGLSAQEIENIRRGAGDWSDNDAMLLRAADELHNDKCLSDETWAGLNRHYTEQQVFDLIFTVGNYAMLAMALNSCGVPVDEGADAY